MTSVDSMNIVTSVTAQHPGLHELENAVAEICVRIPVAAGTAGLAVDLARVAPTLLFREVLTRGGWYRLGGVIDAAGRHIADDVVQWAESELLSHDNDLHAMADDYRHAGSALRASLLTGKTHYLVASVGPLAADFLQLEIEELQEVAAHLLFDERELSSLEELYSPPHDERDRSKAQPIGLPFYALRKLTDVADFLGRLAAQKPEPQTIHRFFDAWQSSSAGPATRFHEHWVVAVREHLDRYRQPILQATPVAAASAPKFESTYGARGVALNHALQHFDRQAGYPMAWFFHLLTTKRVPHAVANAVIDDFQGGFRYLPERDVTVIKDWLHRPYGF